MDLKAKIIEILSKTEYTYSDLADYLGISEDKLNEGLANKSLDFRTLESISKELRIPLYSFFRDENSIQDIIDYKKRLKANLFSKDSTTDDVERLKREIKLLRKILAEKEQELTDLDKQGDM